MMSRVGLLVVVMTIGIPSIAARPASAATGEDAEEPGTHAAAVEAPAPPESAPPAETVATAGERLAPRPPGNDVAWGVALRARYVSVPGWLLGFFTKHNMPLGTFGHYGIEGFRRGGHFQVTLGLSYQNMSPPDGNWLGQERDPTVDTRLLRFRGLSLYSADVAFTGQGMLSSWFGLHAGAGLGLAVVRGSIYVDMSDGCTAANLGDLNQCKPKNAICSNGVCTGPAVLTTSPSGDVIPVVPIVDVLVGMDFRLPDVKGWEAKIDAGFYDAFFVGFAVGYTF